MTPRDHRTTDPITALGECAGVGFSDGAIARAADAQPDAVRSWTVGSAEPTAAEAGRLAALASIARRLAQVIKPEHIATWLETGNPALDDDAPLDRIAADDHRAVARVVSGLEDPGAS